MFIAMSPVAFIASVVAIRHNRFGVASRSALALSALEMTLLAALGILNLLFV